MKAEERRSIALIGFMGVGKTTIGRRLARRLDYQFADSDAEIVRRKGCTVSQLFSEHGEPAFRRMESEAIAALAVRSGLVISTGGGAVIAPENAAILLAHCLTIWLTASPGVVLKRVGNAETRPLLANSGDPYTHVRQLMKLREPQYQAAAHLRVDTTDRRPEAIIEEIVEWLRQEEGWEN